MASRSQRQFMTVCALIIGACQNMQQHYNTKPGCENIKAMIAGLKEKTSGVIHLADGDFTPKQFQEAEKKIGDMCLDGLESAKSYQVYISMLIGILTDTLVDMKPASLKYAPCCDILKVLESMYTYFSIRTRNEQFDVSGMELMESFNKTFKAA